MMKLNKLFGLTFMMVFIVAFTSIPSALSVLDTSYAVMPLSGSSTQPILLWIRVDPLIDTQKMVAYVFWDNIPIGTPYPDITIGRTASHKHAWDIIILPPVGHNYMGRHAIKIWIESESGDKIELNWRYEITSGLPPLDWWETLPPSLIDEIRGFDGATGSQGEQGIQGIQGFQGEQGIVGAVGSQGEQGIIGVAGSQGKQGIVGKSPNFLSALIFSNMVTCILAIAVSIYVIKEELIK